MPEKNQAMIKFLIGTFAILLLSVAFACGACWTRLSNAEVEIAKLNATATLTTKLVTDNSARLAVLESQFATISLKLDEILKLHQKP